MPHRPIHREPVPVDATQLLKLLDASSPEFDEDARPHPLLKAVMRGRVRTQLGLIQRLPLATRSQDGEDGIRTVAIRRSWASPPKRCVFTCTGSSGCNTTHHSSEMRNPVVVRLFGVRSRSRFLVACLFIPPMLPRVRVIRIDT